MAWHSRGTRPDGRRRNGVEIFEYPTASPGEDGGPRQRANNGNESPLFSKNLCIISSKRGNRSLKKNNFYGTTTECHRDGRVIGPEMECAITPHFTISNPCTLTIRVQI
ncbi:hypothetical protein IF2G_01143 [Cordyceps javanica]|nr:hypothetical protein IF2G_01143 [Cordyceps javanica]